jgi:hypothetical protein
MPAAGREGAPQAPSQGGAEGGFLSGLVDRQDHEG